MPGLSEHHHLPQRDLFERFATDPETGLAVDVAVDRLAALGPNSLTEAPGRPTWLRLLDQFRDLLVVILIVGAVLAGSFGDIKDAVAIAVVLVLNALLGFVQEQRAAVGLAALREMLTLQARVRRGGGVQQVDAATLVPGDVVLVEAGDRLPADGRVLEAHAFEVDESALTGESVPVTKVPSPEGLGRATPLADRTDAVYLQTQVTKGRAVLLVAATGDDTEIGKIAALVAGEPESPTPLQRQLDRLGKVLAGISGVVVVAYLILGIVDGRKVTDVFVSAVALLVAAIPEGLPAVVTLTLALGTTRLAKGGAIVKRLRSVETLGSASVICSDKTGTLTLNQMTVERVATLDAEAEVTGTGYGLDGEVAPGIDTSLLRALSRAAALCNDSHVREGDLVGDPTEGALVVFAGKVGVDADQERAARPRVAEVPFDSDNRVMVTAHRAPGDDAAVLVVVKGALEEVAARCTTVCTADGGSVALDDAASATIGARAAAFAQQGMRVLALADRVDDEVEVGLDIDGLRLLGIVAMVDPPRLEARDAVLACHTAGIAVKMITGDHVVTASAIARAVGIEGEALTGAALDELDDAELAARIDELGVFARSSPEHKMRIIGALKARDQIVAMTGDGVNDAPALRAADIGVAMGQTGTEVAKEAADVVLATDDFTTIVGAVEQGRVIYDNIVKFVRFQLATNIGALLTILVAEVLGMPTPFSPIQLLWINLIMDGPPALALSIDPAASGVMRRPPRVPGAQILPMARLVRVAVVGSTMAAAALGLIAFGQHRWGVGVSLTTAFTAFVFFQVVNALGVRDEDRSVFTRATLRNPALWAALAVVLLLQLGVVLIAPVRRVFDTHVLGAEQWVAIVVATIGFFVVQQAVVVLGRARRSGVPDDRQGRPVISLPG
jgi:Ca2+-transporting ATPase